MRRALILLAAVALAACKSPVTKPPTTEGAVTSTVHANGLHLRLRFGAGAVPGQVLLNGTVYKVAPDGGVDLTQAAVAAARAHGGFTLIAPGYAPQVLGPNASGDVTLARAGGAGVPGVTVSLPGTVTFYTPPIGPNQLGMGAGATATGTGSTGTGTGNGSTGTGTGSIGTGTGSTGTGTGSTGSGGTTGSGGSTGPGSTTGPGGTGVAPVAIGLVIDQGAPLSPGPFTLTLDLATWAADPARAEAAKRLLDGIHALDAGGRSQLAAQGITLNGLVLELKLDVGASQAAAGHAEFPQPALAGMGVYLEITLATAELPAPAPTTGVPGPGPNLPTAANWGPGVAEILSDVGAGVIGNNGAALVGIVRVPLLPDPPRFAAVGQDGGKYHLLTYRDGPMPALTTRLVTQAGVAVGAPFTTTASGAYALASVPAAPADVFLDARGTGLGLAGIAPNPGAMVLRSDLDAATTAITDLVLDELRNNGKTMAAFSRPGYDADVAFIRNLLNQAQARWVVQANDVPLVAAFVRRLLAGAAHPVAAIPAAPAPARGTIIRSYSAMQPDIIKLDGAGNMWVLNGGAGNSNLLAPDGTLLANLNAGGAGSSDMAFDPQGNAWTCNGDGSLTKFSPTGALLQTVAFSGSPRGIAIDGKGDIWVANPAAPQRVHHLDASGVQLGTLTTSLYPLGLSFHPATGDLWVADEWIPGRLSRFSSTGAPLGAWTAPQWSHQVLFDAAGDPWTINGTDPGSVSHFKQDGTLVGTYPAGALTSHGAFDDAGNLWAVNQSFKGGGNSVTVFKPDGTVIGTYPVGNRPNGIAKDWAGNLLVTDSFGNKIQVMSP